jgi:hypothetical protein
MEEEPSGAIHDVAARREMTGREMRARERLGLRQESEHGPAMAGLGVIGGLVDAQLREKLIDSGRHQCDGNQ